MTTITDNNLRLAMVVSEFSDMRGSIPEFLLNNCTLVAVRGLLGTRPGQPLFARRRKFSSRCEYLSDATDFFCVSFDHTFYTVFPSSLSDLSFLILLVYRSFCFFFYALLTFLLFTKQCFVFFLKFCLLFSFFSHLIS